MFGGMNIYDNGYVSIGPVSENNTITTEFKFYNLLLHRSHKTFKWEGKDYSTDVKEESNKRTKKNKNSKKMKVNTSNWPKSVTDSMKQLNIQSEKDKTKVSGFPKKKKSPARNYKKGYYGA